MKTCVSQKQMQDLEYDSIHNIGIPSIALMERAALAVAQCARAQISLNEQIFILCGKGNNGADGIAVARMLVQLDYHVTIVTIGDIRKASPEYIIQENIAKKMDIPFLLWSEYHPSPSQWIIDAIFGIGLKREIGGDYKLLIEKVIQSGCENIIAIDIPSGICANTGSILGCALTCRYTVTFGYGKLGLYLHEGRQYSGQITVAPIGFHRASILKATGPTVKILEDSDLTRIPERQEDSNKGTYGRLLIIAGCVGMSGAAYLSAAAAYRMGAGLVKVLTVEDNRSILQEQLPEAIIQGYTKENMLDTLSESCNWATHIIMGPGLGQASYVKELVHLVLKQVASTGIPCPLVLDSDALNTIASYPELTTYLGPHVIITPHMKEMNRLTGISIPELKADPIKYASDFSKKYGITCVLKDSVSVISRESDEIYLTISGNSALAKAGTGDVLTGIIGGCSCLGLNPLEAAAFGSFIHGRAGTLASEEKGKHGVMASDLFSYLYVNV